MEARIEWIKKTNELTFGTIQKIVVLLTLIANENKHDQHTFSVFKEIFCTLRIYCGWINNINFRFCKQSKWHL
jgi:hypothetical protein